MEARGSVPGRHGRQRVQFYGISTCVWCKRTRQFLEEQEVPFDYVYLDLLDDDEYAEVMEEVRRWNPAESFPTVVLGGRCIVGYRPEEIKEALGL